MRMSLKVMAVKKDATHAGMLYTNDSYITAWFMWQLQGDTEAVKASIGQIPAIMNNGLYQDQLIDMQ